MLVTFTCERKASVRIRDLEQGPAGKSVSKTCLHAEEAAATARRSPRLPVSKKSQCQNPRPLILPARVSLPAKLSCPCLGDSCCGAQPLRFACVVLPKATGRTQQRPHLSHTPTTRARRALPLSLLKMPLRQHLGTQGAVPVVHRPLCVTCANTQAPTPPSTCLRALPNLPNGVRAATGR